MELSRSILSDIIVHTKYARYRPELGRKETWPEIVTRNMNMHARRFPELAAEIAPLYSRVLNKEVLPSMRSMQFAGSAIEVGPQRIYNCAYLPIEDIDGIAESMFLLLSGVGVGYSVQTHHVEKLPPLQGPDPTKRRRRFLIGDSIEGWADALKVLLKSYFHGGRIIDFDYRSIRPKGKPLKTSGGKAPGPEPLRNALAKITGLLESAVAERGPGSRIKPIEVHDIMCHAADAVLSGGIRRSAMISLFSMDDEEMLSAKSGNWWEMNAQRARANNSAVVVRGEGDRETFDRFWQYVVNSGSGEPGIYWTNNPEWGTNPCVEIALKPYQFCVAGDTKLITRDGIVRIEDAVGQDVEVWNGEQWSQVNPYLTGEADKLYRVKFSDGSYLDATANHKFLIKTRSERDYREVETLDLIEELKTSKYSLQVPRANVIYEDGVDAEGAYEYGFFLGDGYVNVRGGANSQISADLYNEKRRLPLQGRKVGPYLNWNGVEYETIYLSDLDATFAADLKIRKGLPDEVFAWNRDSVLRFVAGWADADGAQASKGIRIYGREDKLRDAQILLTKVGVDSSLNIMSRKGEQTNLGERKNGVWYLQITRTMDIPCNRLRCENDEGARFRGLTQLVRTVEALPGFNPSYCLTEDELHQCVFNNVLTKQCNLTEINAHDIHDQETLNERARVAAAIGTIQASYTDFHYLREEWQRTVEEDALIGVSMTGIASGGVEKLNLEQAAQVVKETNLEWAAKLGISPAARTTCVKPAGTTSLVLGTSSGIHAWHAPYYIRRIRFGKDEPIAQYLQDALPDLVEPDQMIPGNVVLSVPQAAPEGAVFKDTEDALGLLDRAAHVSRHWVRMGHQRGENTHNVSITANVKDGEWQPVGDWMWEHQDEYNGIAVLPHFGGSYPQLPFEETLREEYERLYGLLSAVDLTQVVEEEGSDGHTEDPACAGGACEVDIA